MFRNKLYVGLPFISAFGMTKRENAFKKVMSSESITILANLELQQSEVNYRSVKFNINLLISHKHDYLFIFQ